MASVRRFLVRVTAVTAAAARASLLTLAVGTAGAAVACAGGPTAPPGMTIVPSSGTSSGPGSMLVAFPRTACTGTEGAVFIDEKGGFVASVAPGTATYLAFPPGASRLFVVASNDVTSTPGAWFRRHEISAPGDRVDHGIVVEVARRDAKNCYRSAPPHPELVTYEAATHAALQLAWLDVKAEDGTRWLDAHRARVNELLGKPPADPSSGAPGATSATHVP